MVKKWKHSFKILNILIENSYKLFFFLASTGHGISSFFVDHIYLPIKILIFSLIPNPDPQTQFKSGSDNTDIKVPYATHKAVFFYFYCIVCWFQCPYSFITFPAMTSLWISDVPWKTKNQTEQEGKIGSVPNLQWIIVNLFLPAWINDKQS